MERANKSIYFYIKKIILVFAVAIGGSLPFILWPETIRGIATVGYIGLAVSCFLTNATLFLPAGGIAFTVSASTVLNPLYCTIVGGMGTACGELISYYCGRIGKIIIEKTELFFKVQKYVNKYGILTVWLFAFLPFPIFDLVGITAGASKMPLSKYLISCVVGKTMKMMMYVFLVRKFLII